MELFGLLLPIVIDYINRKVTDSDKRLVVSIVICAAFGLFFNYVDTQFRFESVRAGFDSITTSIMSTFGLAQLSFKAVWEKTDTHKQLKP